MADNPFDEGEQEQPAEEAQEGAEGGEEPVEEPAGEPEEGYAEGGEEAPAEAAPEPEEEPLPEVDAKSLEIATRLLSEAPPGEFDDCFASLKKFVKDPNVADVAKKQAVEQWMMNQCVPVEIDGHRAIICEEARLPNGEFVDPNTMKTFRFNFDTRKVEEGSGEVIDSSSLRSAMQPVVQKFAAASIRNGNCAVYDAEDGGVTIVVSGSSISKENYRTGSLVMRYKLTKSGELTGSINFQAHFYENGNSVSEQRSEFSDTVSGSSDEDLSVNLVKKITNFYTKWTNALQGGFELLSSEGLDKLRRRLPITRTHVNWQQEIIGAASMPAGRR